MMLDRELLKTLEDTLDPYHPEQGQVPIEILGYGEISLVFSIKDDPGGPIAYKRLPIFSSKPQVEKHITAYKMYNTILEKIGINIPNYDATWVYADEEDNEITLFCAQEAIPEGSVCNELLHTTSDVEIIELLQEILSELTKIWRFNARSNNLQLGFDGQISNFAKIDGKIYYLDTSTPMFRLDGKDAMDGRLFLKSAPPGIRFLLRVFFLKEVLDRYYDFREVIIDLLANFYKEQRSDLIPDLIEMVNEYIEDLPREIGEIAALTEEEIRDYYEEDKFIWTLFQKVRVVHRYITTKIFNQKYPFYLPDHIER